MKKVIFLQILFFLFLSYCFSQTGWVVHSTGTTNSIYDFHFIDFNTGWIVGDNVVLKTTNGGVNWIQQNINYSGGVNLRSVKFINLNIGFVGGGNPTGEFTYKQYFFKTTNGGNNWNIMWEAQNSYIGRINNIIPINENLIYISMFGTVEVFTLGGVLKSTNGGINFSQCPGGGNVSLFFINEFTGWSTFLATSDMIEWTNSKIFKTTNGGLSWQKQFGDSGLYCARLNTIQFINEYTGYNIGLKNNKTLILKTLNGGNNWDSVSYIHTKGSCLFFLNQNSGWISGGYTPDSSLVAFTTNAGVTWSKQFGNPSYRVDKIYFVDILHGWGIGGYNNTNIFRTTTGGVTYINNILNEIPEKYLLFQNYPNPFNPSTYIRYQLKAENGKSKMENGFVFLRVYDILGREISVLVNEKQIPGIYEVSFDGSNLPSGIYFYKLETEGFSDTKRMVLLK